MSDFKIFVGLDPSFKGFGVCILRKHLDNKIDCFISQLEPPILQKTFTGYCKAAFDLAEKALDKLDEAFFWEEKQVNILEAEISVIAEHPPTGGGKGAMMSSPLWALGAITWLAFFDDIKYIAIYPMKASLIAGLPTRGIGRGDRKRATKAYATRILQDAKYNVNFRDKWIGDINNLRKKPKRKGELGELKAFKMSDNEAEAFIYACLALYQEHPELVPIEDSKYWHLDPINPD